MERLSGRWMLRAGRDVVAAAGANSAPATITSSSSASSSLLGHLQRLCGGERPRRLDLGDGGGGRAHTRRMKVELIEAYVRDLTEQNELLLQIVGSLQAEADQRIADMMKNIVHSPLGSLDRLARPLWHTEPKPHGGPSYRSGCEAAFAWTVECQRSELGDRQFNPFTHGVISLTRKRGGHCAELRAGRTLCTARTSPLQEELGRPFEAAGHGGPSLPRDCGGGRGGGGTGGKALGSRGPVWRPGTRSQNACRASSEMRIASSHVEVESRDEKARSLEDTILEPYREVAAKQADSAARVWEQPRRSTNSGACGPAAEFVRASVAASPETDSARLCSAASRHNRRSPLLGGTGRLAERQPQRRSAAQGGACSTPKNASQRLQREPPGLQEKWDMPQTEVGTGIHPRHRRAPPAPACTRAAVHPCKRYTRSHAEPRASPCDLRTAPSLFASGHHARHKRRSRAGDLPAAGVNVGQGGGGGEAEGRRGTTGHRAAGDSGPAPAVQPAAPGFTEA
ncbi:uncharacterized protein LOC144727773 isoform X2 [Lampetra planeri]